MSSADFDTLLGHLQDATPEQVAQVREAVDAPATKTLAAIRAYLNDHGPGRAHAIGVDIPHLIEQVLGPEPDELPWPAVPRNPNENDLPF